MTSANEYILDRSIRHAIYLQRLKTGQVEKLVGWLNEEVYPDLLDTISTRLAKIEIRGYDVGLHTTQRLRDLETAFSGIIREGYRQAARDFAKDMRAFAQAEAQWTAGVMRSSNPLNIDFVVPSPSRLNSIITSSPFEGKIMGDWFSDLGRSTQQQVAKQVNIGLAQGESVDKVVRRLRGTREKRFQDGALNTSRRNAENIVRTANTHVSAQAAQTTYAENSDLIKGVRFVATLDSRTTIICITNDGKVFPLDSGPRPPLHWGCRSHTIPVLKSWEELGIKLKQAPAGTRASMNGQVPADLTYAQWLKQQSVGFQNEVLGPGKAEIFRRGELTIDRFVDDRSNPLSLKELLALEADVIKQK